MQSDVASVKKIKEEGAYSLLSTAPSCFGKGDNMRTVRMDAISSSGRALTGTQQRMVQWNWS